MSPLKYGWPSEGVAAGCIKPRSLSSKDLEIRDELNEKKGRRPRASASGRAWLLLLGVLAATFVCPSLKVSQHEGEAAFNFPHPLKLKQEEEAFCNSTSSLDQQAAEGCAPCPTNAECSDGIFTCKPGYKIESDELTRPEGGDATSWGCVEDLVKKAQAAEMLAVVTALLKERRGRYDCGLPLDPLFILPSKHGESTGSSAIKKMCSGPGLTRWQMHFHPVERHYIFVPIANPVDFPDIHQRLMREQRRSKGLTFAYAYDGPTPNKPLTCSIREVIENHVLSLITMLGFLVIGIHLLHLVYMTYYVRCHVLSLIRQNSHYDEATLLTQGVATETLVQLLRERLDRGHNLSRLLLRNKLTRELVEEVCHELLWTPNTGVHAYRLNETNHWWARETKSYSSSHNGEDQNSISSENSRCVQVWAIPPPVKSVNQGAPRPKEQSVTTTSPTKYKRLTHSQLSYSSSNQLMSCTQAQQPAPDKPYTLQTTLQPHSGDQRYSMEGRQLQARQYDGYSNFMQEFRALQQAKQTIDGELARAVRSQMHNT